MLAHLLGTDEIDRGLGELILSKTEGIPFFIEELVKSLKDLRAIERTENTYRMARDIQKVSIPSKIQDVIMARVDTLPEAAKGLLQTGSVAGREFSHELIKRVTALPEGDLMSLLSTLKDSELLYDRGIYPQSSYIFKHALTQEVAYNSLLLKQRKELHGTIGGVTEELYPGRTEENCEMLAYHYVRSENKDNALEYLVLANRKAFMLRAVEQAKEYFDEIMDLLGTLPDTMQNKQRRISLLLEQRYVFWLLWRTPEYHDLLIHYEPMVMEIGNQELLGGFYGHLGICEFLFGQLDKSIPTLTKAAEICEASGNVEDEKYVYDRLAFSYWFAGDLALVLAFGEKTLKISHAIRNVQILSTMSWAHATLGQFDKAVAEAQKALNIAEEYSSNSDICYALYFTAIAYLKKGDPARAVEYVELAMEKASTPADRIWAPSFLGWALCRAGEQSRGIDLLTQVLPMYQAGRYVPMEIWMSIMLGEGYWLAEEVEKSRQILEEALHRSERLKMKYYIGWPSRLLGEIAIRTNPDKAAAFFDKSVRVLMEIGAKNDLAMAYAGYGRLHKHRGDSAKAREYFEKALEIFDRLGTLTEPEKVREELDELSEAP
jgi:tetratricopeptide (TPR) repeat protein